MKHLAILGVVGVALLAVGLPVVAESGPLAEAGLDQHVEQNRTVHLDGGGSVAPEGEIVGYEWDIEAPNGSTMTPACPTCEQTTFVATQVGTYDVTLTVEDDEGRQDSDTMYVYVEAEDGGTPTPSPTPGPSPTPMPTPAPTPTPTPAPTPDPTPSPSPNPTPGPEPTPTPPPTPSPSPTPTPTPTPTPSPTPSPCDTSVDILGVEYESQRNEVRDPTRTYAVQTEITFSHEADATVSGVIRNDRGDQTITNHADAASPRISTVTMTFDELAGGPDNTQSEWWTQHFDFTVQDSCGTTDTLSDQHETLNPYEFGEQLEVEKLNETLRTNGQVEVVYSTDFSEGAPGYQYSMVFHGAGVSDSELKDTVKWEITYPSRGTYSIEGSYDIEGGGSQQYTWQMDIGHDLCTDQTGTGTCDRHEYVVYEWGDSHQWQRTGETENSWYEPGSPLDFRWTRGSRVSEEFQYTAEGIPVDSEQYENYTAREDYELVEIEEDVRFIDSKVVESHEEPEGYANVVYHDSTGEFVTVTEQQEGSGMPDGDGWVRDEVVEPAHVLYEYQRTIPQTTEEYEYERDETKTVTEVLYARQTYTTVTEYQWGASKYTTETSEWLTSPPDGDGWEQVDSRNHCTGDETTLYKHVHRFNDDVEWYSAPRKHEIFYEYVDVTKTECVDGEYEYQRKYERTVLDGNQYQWSTDRPGFSWSKTGQTRETEVSDGLEIKWFESDPGGDWANNCVYGCPRQVEKTVSETEWFEENPGGDWEATGAVREVEDGLSIRETEWFEVHPGGDWIATGDYDVIEPAVHLYERETEERVHEWYVTWEWYEDAATFDVYETVYEWHEEEYVPTDVGRGLTVPDDADDLTSSNYDCRNQDGTEFWDYACYFDEQFEEWIAKWAYSAP